MPRREDLQSILVLGAGPIVIGQACEFDYSGTQAIKALRDEGYRVVLVNSNPATIMTDPELADATYIEPVTPDVVSLVIERERPDALLPTLGGQTALNCALALAESGVLERYGVELIGARASSIEKAEDRQKFREAMEKIGLESCRSRLVDNLADAVEALDFVGLPAIIRPSFTLGGRGGGIAESREEFEAIVSRGLELSPTHEVLVEESIVGWKEFEMEVVRDRADNCIIICSIENVDPMGVHTGDSITVAPALTLTDKEYQRMRDASLAVLREIGVDTGGSNVQFAVDPASGRLVVIEMNPRVSRSSALASKATGFPIAKIATKLAVGYTLDELDNDITGVTPASFEPTIDYVVTKIPRFTFEKFPNTQPVLSTSMKSVGEAMAIGRSFEESLQKALRSLETGLNGLNEVPLSDSEPEIRERLARRSPDRILAIAQALRAGVSRDTIAEGSGYDPWFIDRLAHIVALEAEVKSSGVPREAVALRQLKAAGFSDDRLAELAKMPVDTVTTLRRGLGVLPVYKRIDTCAAEFESQTPYLYSTYEGGFSAVPPECEAEPSERTKVIILGGGPNRIGQGIEFDYCCCHAVFALAEAGFETIMVNCNPETVSTDYDTSDRLYFEPLTSEDVLEICAKEMAVGRLHGVVVQLGGQTPLKLAEPLEKAGIPILGTPQDAIDLAEDRGRFQSLVESLDLKQPPNGMASTAAEARAIAERIEYPVVVRPSYVLGGRAMEIVYSADALDDYMSRVMGQIAPGPILIDKFLTSAIEVDVDCIADDSSVFVAGVMEHIEEAGVHSGDSACALPPITLPTITVGAIQKTAIRLAKALGVRGLMNVQFAVKDEDIYLLEVNPRASRTVPFVAKAVGIPVAKIAARVMAGEPLASFELSEPRPSHIAFKEAVFPFDRFPGTDPILGPEMRSTGEVMGIDRSIRIAFAKSQIAASVVFPESGTVFISVKDTDKGQIIEPARQLHELGFDLVATDGTARLLAAVDLPVERINKVAEGGPHVVERLENHQIALVINTTEGAQSIADSASIRATAVSERIPYYTTIAGARMAISAMAALRNRPLTVTPMQDYA